MDLLSLRPYSPLGPSLGCSQKSNVTSRHAHISRTAFTCQASKKGGFGRWLLGGEAWTKDTRKKVEKRDKKKELADTNENSSVDTSFKEEEMEEESTPVVSSANDSSVTTSPSGLELKEKRKPAASIASGSSMVTSSNGKGLKEVTLARPAVSGGIVSVTTKTKVEDKDTPAAASEDVKRDAEKLAALEVANQRLQARVAELEAALVLAQAAALGAMRGASEVAESKAKEAKAPEAAVSQAPAEAPATEEEAPAVVLEEAPAVAIREEAPAVVPEEAPAVVLEEAPAVAIREEAPAVVPEEAPAVVLEEAPAVLQEEVVPAVSAALPGWTTVRWPSPKDEVPFWLLPVTAPPPSGTAETPVLDSDRMSIVHITAELAPMAKVGGLADVVTGLARACLARGHHVQVMLPFYDCMETEGIEGLSLAHTYGSYHKGDWLGVQAHQGNVAGIPVILLKPENHFFRGARIYGGSYNELEAYIFFARASLEYLQMTKQQPAILHVHEWHTAVVGMLYWDMYHWLDLKKPRLVLTIHNMEHHGECKWEELDACGLNGQSYLTLEKAMDDRTIGHNPERLSLLKGGIVYSNAVTTVSPTYVQETLCSGWLAATLHTYRDKYTGILNGIDTQIWDPAADPHLPAPFTATDLSGKAICKHYVQRGLGLDLELPAGGQDGTEGGPRIPLVVCVTRLVAQKGIHLIRHALYRTLEQGGQFVLLGSAPDPRIQGDFDRLAEEFKASPNARLLLTYSESLSHHLYAAGDLVLVPSMFEPCGLTQMIGMRYGMIPVVRRTGGLADTVFDVDNAADQSRANGFVFDGIDEGSLNGALDRGLRYYKERPEWWAELTAKVMDLDNSWNKSAGEYLDLYRSVRVQV